MNQITISALFAMLFYAIMHPTKTVDGAQPECADGKNILTIIKRL